MSLRSVKIGQWQETGAALESGSKSILFSVWLLPLCVTLHRSPHLQGDGVEPHSLRLEEEAPASFLTLTLS